MFIRGYLFLFRSHFLPSNILIIKNRINKDKPLITIPAVKKINYDIVECVDSSIIYPISRNNLVIPNNNHGIAAKKFD
jgi:hypothetical protein